MRGEFWILIQFLHRIYFCCLFVRHLNFDESCEHSSERFGRLVKIHFTFIENSLSLFHIYWFRFIEAHLSYTKFWYHMLNIHKVNALLFSSYTHTSIPSVCLGLFSINFSLFFSFFSSKKKKEVRNKIKSWTDEIAHTNAALILMAVNFCVQKAFMR